MKIFIDAHIFDHGYEGSRSYIEGLYGEMVKCSPDITFIFASNNISILKKVFGDYSNVRYVKYLSSSRILRLLFEIPFMEIRFNPDYSHFQYVMPLIKISKAIVTIHDVLFLDYPEYFPTGYRWLRKWFFSRSVRKADILLTVSEYSRGRIISLLPVKDKKIHVIPNGVNQRFFENRAGDSQGSNPTDRFGKYILSVGRFEPRKNQLMLLEAFIELGLYKKGYSLVFIGKKSIRYDAFSRFLDLQGQAIRKRIIILDKIQDDEIVHFYRNCSLFIYPSHAEGFGLPPLEAYVTGTPVIVACNTALADFRVLKENMFVSGDKTDLKNRMVEVLARGKQTESPGRDTFTFTWEKSAALFSNLLRDRISGSNIGTYNTVSSTKLAILGTRGIPATYGGFETFAEELSERLVKNGVEVFIYSERKVNGPEVYKGVNIRYSGLKKQGNQIRYYLTGLRWASGFADVIMNAGSGGALFYTIFRSRRRILVTNMDGLEHKRDKWSFWAKWYLKFSESVAMRYSDYIIADCSAIENYLKASYPKFSGKTRVIVYGAYTSPGNDQTALTDLALSPGSYYLVVARLEPENNIDMVIEGFLRSGSKCKLVITGPLMDTKYCRSLLRMSNDRVVFAGGIYARERLATLRRYAKAYLHGHSVGGTNPSLLESMAQGSVCICHDNPFNREVTNNDQYYFSDAGALAKAILHLEQLETSYMEKTRQRNIERVKTFYSWDLVAGQYIELLREIANSLNPK